MKKGRSSVLRQADFFNSLGEEYLETVENEYLPIYSRTSDVIKSYIRGDLLDIGSGGVNLFTTHGQHVFYDISPVLLSSHKREDGSDTAIERFSACGESASLPFRESSFDTVLFHFSIHHFAQESFEGTIRYIESAVCEAERILRPGGRIVIAENTLSGYMAKAEAALFPLMTAVLDLLSSPPVFLLSEEMLLSIIRKSFGTVEKVCSFKQVSKLLVLPVDIPLYINPVTIKVLVAEKEI